MQLIHFYHRHHVHRFAKHPDFYFFELAIWLHTVARSFIAVFVPILLYKSGYSISNIILFYLIFNSIDVPLNFVADHLMRKIGARKVMILGTFATITFFVLLGILPPAHWPLLIVLAFLAAIYDTFFWVAHIYMFIEANREVHDTGKTVSALEGVRRLASVIGPLIGALIFITMGKVSLVIASVAIFTLSIIPLFKMRHVRDIPDKRKVSFREFFSSDREKKDYLSLSLWGVHNEVDGTLWPLFIFTLFGTVESVAIVPVIVSLSTILFSYIAGKLTKHYGTRMILVGSFIIACMWILRLTLQNTPLYYATVFLVGIFSLLVAIPLDVNITAGGLKISSLSASTYRNATSMLLRIPLYGALTLLVEVFKVSFGVAASSLFVIIFIILLINSKINMYKTTNSSSSN
ncbi:MFS transporter [Candidatus Roizmanbacteria bacterium]|nr:MFS transporter [Candidatus Roizmanbacteria bacterium]